MPLPPFEVQKGIAAFINKEFSSLDEAKEQVYSVLDSSEERKQSILHKTFTGELTEKWRAINNISISSWKHKPLIDVCSGLKYGTLSKSVKQGKIAVVRMGNLQHGEIEWNDPVYSNNEADNEKYKLKDGDVLFNRTNSPELVGKTSIYRGQQPTIYAGYLIKLDYGDELIGEYLNFIMNSPEAKKFCNSVKTDGVNQSNISAKKIGEFVIPVPAIAEQEEIVKIVNQYVKHENYATDATDQVEEQIEQTRKSILSQAFHGELNLK